MCIIYRSIYVYLSLYLYFYIYTFTPPVEHELDSSEPCGNIVQKKRREDGWQRKPSNPFNYFSAIPFWAPKISTNFSANQIIRRKINRNLKISHPKRKVIFQPVPWILRVGSTWYTRRFNGGFTWEYGPKNHLNQTIIFLGGLFFFMFTLILWVFFSNLTFLHMFLFWVGEVSPRSFQVPAVHL